MSNPIGSLLREVITERTADVPPPTGLARGAMRRARRRRLAQAGVLTAVTAAVIAVPVALVVLGRPGGTTAPAPGPAPEFLPGGPAGKTQVVTAFSGLRRPEDAGPADDVSLVLNTTTGRYDEIPYPEAIPSPDGRRFLVTTGDNGQEHPTRAGVLTLATGKVRWITGYGGFDQHPTWSPTGDRVLYTRQSKDGASGFVLVDVTTLRETFVPVSDPEARDGNLALRATGLKFVWVPDGRQVVRTLSTNAADESLPGKVVGLRYYGLDGKPARTVSTSAGALSNGSDISPDGSAVALWTWGGGEVVIIDPAARTVRGRFPLLQPGNWVVGWYDAEHLILVSYDDTGAEEVTGELRVVTVTGQVVRTVALPERLPATAGTPIIYVGSAAELGPAAAALAF